LLADNAEFDEYGTKGNSTREKRHACPICGKVYRKSDAEDDDEENAWIRCDDCHRWVMTKCDNIEDLSIYDDSNPNHLHYSCPMCRNDKKVTI
jgi:DNA-directed RNA polymerase subunit RPC12/RpoP